MTARDAIREVADGVKLRTARAATTNITSIWGESVPLWGIAINVAATGFELRMACDTMRDINDLELALGGNPDPGETDQVCGIHVPTGTEILNAVVAAPDQLWATATSDVEELTGTTVEGRDLEAMPEKGWLGDWFE